MELKIKLPGNSRANSTASPATTDRTIVEKSAIATTAESASKLASEPANANAKLSGRQTWEKPGKKRVTFDLKRSESLNSSSSINSNNNNNDEDSTVSNCCCNNRTASDRHHNHHHHQQKQLSHNSNQSIKSPLTFDRQHQDHQHHQRQQPSGDSTSTSSVLRMSRDDIISGSIETAVTLIDTLALSRDASSSELSEFSVLEAADSGSTQTVTDSEVTSWKPAKSAAGQERLCPARVGSPCRVDYISGGYSPIKTHRRKASLGTKDFAIVFPDLVSDNFEYRCRVVV